MKKKYFFVVIPYLLSAICGISYKMIGQEIAPDGTLVEAFGFIPLSFLFFFIGTAAAIILVIKSAIKNIRKSKDQDK
ncbi:MAG: DUF3955 domain-containing protein [Synergistaceae bacterium]|nr:DUF3955 domain-containing protein [Synergistaceae bacterium]